VPDKDQEQLPRLPRTAAEALGYPGMLSGVADLFWYTGVGLLTWFINAAADASGRGNTFRIVELLVTVPVGMAIAPVRAREVAGLKNVVMPVYMAAMLGLAAQVTGTGAKVARVVRRSEENVSVRLAA